MRNAEDKLMSQRHQTDHDHEVWLRCFTAAIAAALPAREAMTDPTVLVEWCGKIADAALEVERQRRHESGYQALAPRV
jgi:hypothetical protein